MANTNIPENTSYHKMSNHENTEKRSSDALKEIKHQFMVYRNGIISETLRNAGMPYNVIFGLQLPQLSQIARSVEPSMSLASELWADKTVRESRLLACYLFPKEDVDETRALQLAQSVQTPEEADILCFRLLRYLPFASALPSRLQSSPNPHAAYCATALLRNLASI